MYVQQFSQFCVAKGSTCPSLSAFHHSTGSRGHEWHIDDTDGTWIIRVILFLKVLVFMITKKTIWTWRCRYFEIIAIVVFSLQGFLCRFSSSQTRGKNKKTCCKWFIENEATLIHANDYYEYPTTNMSHEWESRWIGCMLLMVFSISLLEFI